MKITALSFFLLLFALSATVKLVSAAYLQGDTLCEGGRQDCNLATPMQVIEKLSKRIDTQVSNFHENIYLPTELQAKKQEIKISANRKVNNVTQRRLIFRSGTPLDTKTPQASNKIQSDINIYNHAHNFAVEFRSSGLWVTKSKDAGWGMSLHRFGRVKYLKALVNKPDVVLLGNRIEYKHHEVLEWYENRADGLEQGFTLAKRPLGNGDVILEILVRTENTTAVLRDKRTLEILSKEAGLPLFHYGGLTVVDAAGHNLDSRLELKDQVLRIAFNDDNAHYPVTVDPVITDAPWQIIGDQNYGRFGSRVVSAGDVNGDKYEDVIVQSPFLPGSSISGEISVYLGSESGLSTSAVWTISGDDLDESDAVLIPHLDLRHSAIGTLGDIDGDGFSDVYIGDSLYNPDQVLGSDGRVLIWYGGPGDTINPSGLGDPASPDLTIFAPSAFSGNFGNSVAATGDLYGDGFGDIAVTDSGWGDIDFVCDDNDVCTNTFVRKGAVYIYDVNSRTEAIPQRIATGVYIEGCSGEYRSCKGILGASVVAGDINGDSLPELLVGIEGLGSFSDSVHVCSITDESCYETSTGGGTFVTTATGDVNGDGFADLVVGRTVIEGGGWLDVAYGSVNGLSGATFTYELSPQCENSGLLWDEDLRSEVAVGDVNGDGVDDVAVSEPSWIPLTSGSGCASNNGYGRVLVFHGSESGITGDPENILKGNNYCGSIRCSFGEGLALANVNGPGVADGDIFHDLIVGAPNYEIGAPDFDTALGAAFAFHGFGVGLSQREVDFGDIALGVTISTETITILNGGRPITDLSISVEGVNPGDFTVTNDCPDRLEQGDHCTITVSFSPQSTGRRSAKITIKIAEEELTVDLAGVGVPPPPPFAAPVSNDHSFVEDDAPMLGSCLYRSEGPIEFYIPVNRVITKFPEDRNTDGTIKPSALGIMKENGIISAYAILKIAAFNVDLRERGEDFSTGEILYSGASKHRVIFNGHDLGPNGSQAFLTGTAAGWSRSTYQVPIEWVKFPELQDGPAQNTQNSIKIEIDTTSDQESWCVAAGWGALGFKAMSPIVMIHGNSSDPFFWSRQGFTGYLDGLNLPNDKFSMCWDDDNSYSPCATTIRRNALSLDTKIPDVVRRWGVDSVHLVAHSKGGLDTREWLTTYYSKYRNKRAQPYFKVLTLTTLSTPHRGSVAADMQMAWERAIWVKGTSILADLGFKAAGTNPGTPNLTTYYLSDIFNPNNVPRLPPDVVYRAVGADLDSDGDGHVFLSRLSDGGFIVTALEEIPEWGTLIFEDEILYDVAYGNIEVPYLGIDLTGPSLAARIVDIPYQLLKDHERIELNRKVVQVCVVRCFILTVVYYGEAKGKGGPNDMAVTRTSASGPPGGHFNILPFVTRNHADVANGGVAEMVVPYLKDTERERGDLQ